MKVDFSAVLKGIHGEALTEGNGPAMTLGLASELALVAMTPQAQRETGEEKYRNWKLAQRACQGGAQDITPEEATLIKVKIGEFFGATAVGPAYEILNG